MSRERILIVDDEKEIADLLEVYLTSEGYEVRKFYSGEDAWHSIAEDPPDLAILDVMLPDTNGFTLCRRIRESYFFPVIMLTAKIEETDKVSGILLGADDYITKPFHTLEVLARVKAQLRRAAQYNRALPREKGQEHYDLRGLTVDVASHSCSLYGEPLDLTPTEFGILLYLFRHLGEVATSEDIFEAVWQEKYYEGNNTVFVHVARLREKMHENARRPKFIQTVWGVGYKLGTEEHAPASKK